MPAAAVASLTPATGGMSGKRAGASGETAGAMASFLCHGRSEPRGDTESGRCDWRLLQAAPANTGLGIHLEGASGDSGHLLIFGKMAGAAPPGGPGFFGFSFARGGKTAAAFGLPNIALPSISPFAQVVAPTPFSPPRHGFHRLFVSL